MWFKNLSCFVLTKGLAIDQETLEKQCGAMRTGELTREQVSKWGFISPWGEDSEQLVHAADGAYRLAVEYQEKIVPAAIVNKQVKERVRELEKREGRPARKAERDDFKEQVIKTMLPVAFVRSKIVQMVILPEAKFVLIDSAASAQAESVLSLLRQAIGSLPVVPLMTSVLPEEQFKEWVEDTEVEQGNLQLVEDVLFKAAEGGASAKFKDVPFDSDTVQSAMAGNMVKQIGLQYGEDCSFVLDGALVFRRLKFDESLTAQSDDIDKDDVLAKTDADFVLFVGSVTQMLNEVTEALGGIDAEI
ncbi:recombination-associated protein RdgC [Ferrimonas marina]|uniref:Recombination-associated protein RdgC n=1 Tax=Ferrimonas marina TaxID=299255 RepID=A0A1M5UHJ3_9GAMM|nr:recombination-associated protein RdgC [Ferrimonas marina]SHH62484.1 recombination associated protein RdgC [Ferrimonas marina]